MRTLAALLSVLLLSLPIAGSLPVLCGNTAVGKDEMPRCCCHKAPDCKGDQLNALCCLPEKGPASASLPQVTMPAPVPAPELPALTRLAPVLTLHLSAFHPAIPPGAYHPALYVLHQSYRI